MTWSAAIVLVARTLCAVVVVTAIAVGAGALLACLVRLIDRRS